MRKRFKYNNIPTIIDGIKFDSKAEGKNLTLRQRERDIQILNYLRKLKTYLIYNCKLNLNYSHLLLTIKG